MYYSTLMNILPVKFLAGAALSILGENTKGAFERARYVFAPL